EGRRQRAQAAQEQWNKLTLDANEQLRRAKLLEDLERNLEGFAQSVKQVMKEAHRGMLSGVCGPVSQLLKTPREYAVALETALGASMQHVVVETEQDAKNAIRLLKQRDWGRATFLPLSTIRGNVYNPREIEAMPGFVGMANTLCSCEERYGSIRDNLLGRVAVAEDLDSAASIAKKTGYRLRVVSLDGQVVNAGGSLTGGSRGRNSGLLSRASEIERVKEKAAALQQQAAKAQEGTASARRSSPPARGSSPPPVGSFPPPKRSASASSPRGLAWPRSWSSWRKTPPAWSGSAATAPAACGSWPSGSGKSAPPLPSWRSRCASPRRRTSALPAAARSR
ncbi:MAG: hypothetical protein ACLULM_06950, partial [Acutalibacter sp.]